MYVKKINQSISTIVRCIEIGRVDFIRANIIFRIFSSGFVLLLCQVGLDMVRKVRILSFFTIKTFCVLKNMQSSIWYLVSFSSNTCYCCVF